MQTLDCVSGLNNCLEFAQLSMCLDEAMKTQKKISITYMDYGIICVVASVPSISGRVAVSPVILA